MAGETTENVQNIASDATGAAADALSGAAQLSTDAVTQEEKNKQKIDELSSKVNQATSQLNSITTSEPVKKALADAQNTLFDIDGQIQKVMSDASNVCTRKIITFRDKVLMQLEDVKETATSNVAKALRTASEATISALETARTKTIATLHKSIDSMAAQPQLPHEDTVVTDPNGIADIAAAKAGAAASVAQAIALTALKSVVSLAVDALVNPVISIAEMTVDMALTVAEGLVVAVFDVVASTIKDTLDTLIGMIMAPFQLAGEVASLGLNLAAGAVAVAGDIAAPITGAIDESTKNTIPNTPDLV